LANTEAQAIRKGTDSALIGKGKERCAVVIDAGSTGSRVHVFKFEGEGEELTLLDSTFKAIEPGLSSFASDPEAAGKSLIPLLEEAKAFVPDGISKETTVELRATAGLRMLEPREVHRILEEVTAVLQTYPFKVLDDSVSVMEGSDEGVFMWVSTNYYLGNIGKVAEETASVIDLGGGSVQRAFAINDAVPESVSEDSVRTISAGGKAYTVYVHSYLGYGLKAARLNFLRPFDSVQDGHPCINQGYLGRYHYVDENVAVKSDENEPANVDKCVTAIEREMHLDEDCGVEKQCFFDGIWNGGQGGGNEHNYVSSYIVDIARDVGVIPRESTKSIVSLENFRQAAERVCSMDYDQIKANYSFYLNNDSDIPFICMDTIYSYVLLKEGFRLRQDKDFTVVKQFEYKGKQVEAAWPLGAAIHTIGKHSVQEILDSE
jgi:apyrase